MNTEPCSADIELLRRDILLTRLAVTGAQVVLRNCELANAGVDFLNERQFLSTAIGTLKLYERIILSLRRDLIVDMNANVDDITVLVVTMMLKIGAGQ